MNRYVVTCAHTESYADALVVNTDDTVALSARDDEWPGWIRCRDVNGKGGWLPEEIIEQNGDSVGVREPFDTAELTVGIDERVWGGHIFAGWQWCRTQDGREGWLPIRCLHEPPTAS